MDKFSPPEFKKSAFNCPHCDAYAHQTWVHKGDTANNLIRIYFAQCSKCKMFSIWYVSLSNEPGRPLQEKQAYLVFPERIYSVPPHEDMPARVKKIYREAGAIVPKSPKAAAALLRLALRVLLESLGYIQPDLDKQCQELVKDFPSDDLKKVLELLRVSGQTVVMPGVIDLNDNREVANELFEILNFIVQSRITFPVKLREMANFAGKTPPEKAEDKNRPESKLGS